MATINLGSIKFNWQGAYAGGTAYAVDDVVSYNGSSYICKLASTGNLPTNTTYWDQMSSAGTNGTDLTSTLTTQGDLVYRDGSGLQRLGAGTAGQALITGGAGANPSWGSVAGGKVLQVVQTVKTDIFSTTNTYSSGGFADITGLSVTITPSATSSKILVLVQIYNSVSANTQFFNLIRGATNLLQPASGTLKATIGNEDNMGNVSITFLDSPSTTSATTYKVATCREGAGTVYINRRSDSTDHTGSSTITAIEIGA